MDAFSRPRHRLPALAAVLLLAACSPGAPNRPSRSPSPTLPAAASLPQLLLPPSPPPPAPASEPRASTPARTASAPRFETTSASGLGPGTLVVLMDWSANRVEFLDLEGHLAGSVGLGEPGSLQFAGAGSDRALFVSAGHVYILDRHGAVADVGTAPIGDSYLAGPGARKLAAGTVDWTAAHSDVYVSGSSLDRYTKVASLDSPQEPRYLRPYRWTDGGALVIAASATGIGGYILFAAPFGAVEVWNPAAGQVTAVSGSDRCAFGDRLADGGYACIRIEPSQTSHAVTLELHSAGGQVKPVALPVPAFNQAGAVSYTPDGKVMLGGAISAGMTDQPGNGEHYVTAVVDPLSGSVSTLVDGYRPAFDTASSVLPDGSLLLSRPAVEPGLWLRSPSGALRKITAGNAYPVALMPAA